MSKIFRTIAFVLVLGALLAWGVMSMAHGPSQNSSVRNINVLHGRSMETGVPVSRDQIQRVDR
jgi:hypothetical protein